jgi:hypothetical protein
LTIITTTNHNSFEPEKKEKKRYNQLFVVLFLGGGEILCGKEDETSPNPPDFPS